ncbi:MAG: hypothetical protein NZ516_01380 [Raineya sp.]|nr:hypothetical protein [Raineya sp.]
MKFSLATMYDAYYARFTQRTMFGIGVKRFLGEKVSLNNRILFGINPDKQLMLHYGLGGLMVHGVLMSGNTLFLTSNLLFDFVGFILLPFIIPEGIQLHFGKGSTKIAPYIYPASFEYNINIVTRRELQAIFETGIQLYFVTSNDIVVSPNIGWKIRYRDNLQAVSVGLLLGLEKKKAEKKIEKE